MSFWGLVTIGLLLYIGLMLSLLVTFLYWMCKELTKED